MKMSRMVCSVLLCLASIRMLSASDVSLDVDTGDALHLVYDASSPVSAVISNVSSTVQAVAGRLEVRDWKGRGFTIPVSGTLPPEAVRRYPLPAPLPAKGFYWIRLFEDKSDKPVASTSFAFVERHKVTPLLTKPKFRFGFTDHPLYYAPAERRLLYDAFVASGAKLARVGLGAFGDVMSEGEGCFDWRESDEGVEAFRSRGISINATIYGRVPRWAAESNRVANCIRDKVEWAIGCMPPRKGLFRDYCRALAARYGTQIDYYEIGNEFDMVPRWILPPNVALRLQREAWEGIKESCPTACVTTCGWAVGGSDDYFHNGKRLPNLGIMEEFLEKGKGWFDVLPVHLHGSFGNYETRLNSKFFPLLQRYGIKQPWYSNETADHISGGREVPVAIDVWRKILYAWAHGSTDYTWYNLRAKTGRAGAGVEWAYGVMTHDWHPMPAFASFCALAAIFNGLDFECAYADGDKLKVYRFKGGDRIVLAGWTSGGERRSAVHLVTDAHGAELYDVMGQRMPLAIEDGKLRWEVTEEPSALVLSAGTQVKVESAPLKFLSFNIWGDYFKNPVSEREAGIEASILKDRPEVVSLQEVTPNWYKSPMFANLGKHGYDLVRGDEEAALSRAAFTGKKTAEHINHEPILYRKDRLKLLDSGTEFFHLALQTSKSVTWAVLEDRTSGRRFAAFATHFWWQNNGKESDTIRELNARHVLWLLADIRRKWGEALPAILGGDLNSVEKSLAHEMLRRGGFFNAASHADVRSTHCSHHGDPKRGADGKYHGSLRPAKDDTPDRSIDHIYYTKGIHALRHEIGTDQQALDATDHSPVLVEFTVEDFPTHGLIAHRGDAAEFPESTIPAFRSAVEKGAEMIELDEWRCKTGELVVMHDHSVDRTTNGKGRIADLTLTEIKALDAGIKRGRQFAGLKVLTLDEALAVFPKTGLYLNIHCKTGDAAPEVAELLRRTGRLEQGILMMDSPEALAVVRSRCPWAKTGLVINTDAGWAKPWTEDEAWRKLKHAARAGVEFVQILPNCVCTREQFAYLHDRGIRTTYFVANDEETLRAKMAEGHDFIFTDRYSALRVVYDSVM